MHLFFVQTEANLDDLRITFTRGLEGKGLRPPDPDRDVADLVVPEEKGILAVRLSEFFDRGGI